MNREETDAIMCVDLLVFSDDLIFTSRITASAAAQGLVAQLARTPERLTHMLAQSNPAGVILDLAHPQLALGDMLDAIKNRARPPRVVAYGPHVEAASLHAARAAGCDLVLTRSQFASELERSLADWIRPAGRTDS